MMSDQAPSEAPTSVLPRVAILLLIVAACGLFYVLGGHRYLAWDSVRGRIIEARAWVDDHLLLAALAFVAIYVATTALSLPIATGLSLTAGALFGRWLGAVLACSAATVGATLAMLLTRYLFRDAVERRWGPKLEPLQRGFERDGAFYLFTLRLVFVVPYFLINLGMGLTRIRPGTFAAVSFVAMLPASFVYANAGATFERVESLKDVVSPEVLGSFALIGIVPLAIRKALQWSARRRET
jgi:uncharacterized membrane protein YdjX (TVP38/TMEM64 family)